MRRKGYRVLAALMVGAVTLLAMPGVAVAEGQGAAALTVTAVAVEPVGDGEVAVSAMLVDGNGQPIRRQEVQFYLAAELLGPREAYLGSAMTDSSGVATFRYNPTWEGTQHIVVRPTSNGSSRVSEATVEFEVAGIRSYELEPMPLRQLREWTPVVVGLVVMAVWGTMAMVLLRVGQGVIVAGRQSDTTARRYPVRTGIMTSRSFRR